MTVQVLGLTSSATTDESKIVELGDLVLHDGCAISQFAEAILVIARSNGNQGAVADFIKCNDLERYRKGLV